MMMMQKGDAAVVCKDTVMVCVTTACKAMQESWCVGWKVWWECAKRWTWLCKRCAECQVLCVKMVPVCVCMMMTVLEWGVVCW